MTKPILAAALGFAAIIASPGCTGSEPRLAAATATVAATTRTASVADLTEAFETGGVVRAKTVAVVASRIMAEVKSVRVRAGDRVRAGQALVILDARDLQAGRVRAQSAEAAATHGATMAEADRKAALAMLSLAQVGQKRISDLTARNSATRAELDEAVATLRSAEARVQSADARVAASAAEVEAAAAASAAASTAASYATLAAPFDGVVTETAVETGNMLGPGQGVVTVEDTSGFRLETRLDESRAALVKAGDSVHLSISGTALGAGAAGAQRLEVAGRIVEVARALSADSHDFLVKVALPGGVPVRSGMYGKVRFAGTARRALVVPSAALVRRGQLAFVYVVERDNRAHLRLVNAGEPADGAVEIRSGLVAGDRVVSPVPPTLTDGSPVTAGGR